MSAVQSSTIHRSAILRHVREFIAIVRFAIRRSGEERLAQVAGSLTFNSILSLVPLAAIIFALISPLPIFDQIQDALRNMLVANLVPAELSATIFRYLDQFASKARGLTVFGLLFLGMTALSTMFTIDHALNTIWRVNQRRPFGQRLLVYSTMLTVGPLLLALSLTLTSTLLMLSGVARRPPMMMRFTLDVTPVLVIALAYAALYRYVPNRPVRWREALGAGGVAAVAFEIAKHGFAVYISSAATYSTVYGALAVLPIFLLWIYLSWLITLFGAMLAATWPTLRYRHWSRGATPGEIFADALLVLRALYAARQQRLRGLTLNDVREQARLGWNEAETLLERLETLGLVIRTRALARQRVVSLSARASETELWVFVADPRAVRLEQVYRAFVYDGPRVARIVFHGDDSLGEVVRAVRFANLDATLADIFGAPA